MQTWKAISSPPLLNPRTNTPPFFRLRWAIVIAHRPSGVNLHIFDFSSQTAERNSTKLDRKQDLNALYQVCVIWADRKNKMAALASDWLRHFRLLLWNCWKEFNETRSQRPLPSLCFSGQSEKQDGRHGLWLAETFSTSPLNGIQRNLTGSKISTPSTKFVFFWSIGKRRWPPWPLIGWYIFDFFSSKTAERNSTKLDRKQDINVLYQVVFFGPIGKTRWPPDLWMLRHFRLLLWNRWTEFNKTWQEARSQRPLPSLCFSGWSEKQDGHPGLWLVETFLTSPLKPLNGNQRHLTGSKIKKSATKFVFFRPIGKTRLPPCPLIGWDIFRLLLWNHWTEFNETWQEARSQHSLPSLCFSGRSVNKNVRLGRFLKKVAHCTQVHDMWPIVYVFI